MVPDNPIIPFIEGDGTGRDIWKASVQRVRRRRAEGISTASVRSFGTRCLPGKRPKASSASGCRTTPSNAIKEYRIAIKGPLDDSRGWRHSLAERSATPDSGSLCLRAAGEVIPGAPSPVKHPEKMNIIIFRENTEDVYAGIEWREGTPEGPRLIEFVNNAC